MGSLGFLIPFLAIVFLVNIVNSRRVTKTAQVKAQKATPLKTTMGSAVESIFTETFAQPQMSQPFYTPSEEGQDPCHDPMEVPVDDQSASAVVQQDVSVVMSAEQLRDAVVLSEIIGKPRALRRWASQKH